MMQQGEASESIHEQASSSYGRYEGDQEYARQRDETSYEQPLREGPGGKVYSDNRNMFRLLVFVISMVVLFAFAVLCLVFVGGTGGWIGFCAASLAVFVTASTAISLIK